MCSEMKRLGLQVIYADETRMVLGTRRFSLEDSRQTMRYSSIDWGEKSDG